MSSTLISKPKAGFQTPYQLLLDSVSNFILSKENRDVNVDEVLVSKWDGISENDVDIVEPVSSSVDTSKSQWTCIVSSSEREIQSTPVSFETMRLSQFLKTVLTNGLLKPLRLGVSTKEEGFYLAEGTGEIVLIVKDDYDFRKGVAFSGLEFKPDMFMIANNRQSLIIDNPVVYGKLQIMYID